MKRGSLIILLMLLCAAPNVFAAGKLKLIIDAGHGGTDVGSKTKAGDKESDICLQLAEAVADYAKDNGIEVEMTRTKKNQTLSFDQRSGYKAAAEGKTYYISIHFDAAKDESIHGARIRYSDHTKYTTESKRLAETLSKSLEKITGSPCPKEEVDAIVFMKNQVPSIMIEPGRMSNKGDMEKIKDKSYRKEIAMNIVQAAMIQ
jgi:N-acetylmuramoyl-L-alanine amidase